MVRLMLSTALEEDQAAMPAVKNSYIYVYIYKLLKVEYESG